MTQLTVTNFETETNRYESVVVMFYAGWCSKCAIMKPMAERIEKKHEKEIKLFLVDIDKESELARRYKVDMVSTFLMIKAGEVEGVMSGMISEKTFERRITHIV